jgi:CO dehydrogenase/acetyl-CoA synthase delta subunit
MAFQAPVETSTAKIRELTLGSKKTVAVGGQNALAFHAFEGTLPNAPKIAMEVSTRRRRTGPRLKRVLGDVWADPVAWAKKCEAVRRGPGLPAAGRHRPERREPQRSGRRRHGEGRRTRSACR